MDETIHLTIPPRLYQIPATAVAVGGAIGIMRGGRDASLRFLAENAHRPPRTVQGWYFYNKTKNYRVMLGALQGAGRWGTRLGLVTGTYAVLEEGVGRVLPETKQVAAGLMTGALLGAVKRGIWKQTVVLGLVMGTSQKMLDLAQGYKAVDS